MNINHHDDAGKDSAQSTNADKLKQSSAHRVVADLVNDNQVALRTEPLGAGLAVFPQCHAVDWNKVSRDHRCAIVFTNTIASALKLCRQGQPAIAVIGVTQHDLKAWLALRGANVSGRLQ